MKTTLLVFLSIVAVARADPAFVGMLSTRDEGHLFRIIPSEGAAARWVKVGDTVDGYSVTSFKAKDDVLILKKAGRTYSLKLKEGKVLGGGGLSSEALIEAAAKILARMDKWTSDVSYQVGMGPDGYWYVYASKVVDGEKELRRVRLTPEGKATNWSKLIAAEDP